MKFKAFKKLKRSQKVPCSKAFYDYFRNTGQFTTQLVEWDNLKWKCKVNMLDRVNPSLHDYIATQLSSYDVPFWKELPRKVKTNNELYYNVLVESVTGDSEVFKISGTISNGTDPISGAVCTIDDESVTTGTDGKYEFTGMYNGVYTLKVTATGYESKSSQVTVNGANVTRDLTLTAETE